LRPPFKTGLEREDFTKRLLSALQKVSGMDRVSLLIPASYGEHEIRVLVGETAGDLLSEGGVIRDMGAAAATVSSGRAELFNTEEDFELRVPYARSGVRIRGGMAIPAMGGIVWADRASRNIDNDEFEAFGKLLSLVDEQDEAVSRMSEKDERARYLVSVLEGLRMVVSTDSEQECVGALVETATGQTGADRGVTALLDGESLNLKVVGVAGRGTEGLLGSMFDSSQGLVALAMKSGTAVPTGFRFKRRMRPILGSGADLSLADDDGLVIYPVGLDSDTVGVLVLTGGDFDSSLAIHGIRTLCDSAALIINRFRMQGRMERDAMVDGLTGLYNRQAFMQRMAETFSFCSRHSHELSMLMVDADHFKKVNDNHGHLVGDKVLRFITDTVKRGLRGSDIAGRYGGEEFCVLLPHTEIDGARLVAERIREQCAASAVPIGEEKLRVTVSIGVSRVIPSMQGPEDLIEAADKALYKAKEEGRDRVVVSNG